MQFHSVERFANLFYLNSPTARSLEHLCRRRHRSRTSSASRNWELAPEAGQLQTKHEYCCDIQPFWNKTYGCFQK